jgi:hypothetical protein
MLIITQSNVSPIGQKQSKLNLYKKGGLFLAVALSASLLTACGGGGGTTTSTTSGTPTTTGGTTTTTGGTTTTTGGTTTGGTTTGGTTTGGTTTAAKTFTKLNLTGAVYVADGVQTLGCVKDSQTNKFWEVKTNAAVATSSDFRDVDYGYRWGTAGSTAGTPAGSSAGAANTCSGVTKCNPESYVTAANAMNGGQGLCGKKTWRMPTADELMGLLDTSKAAPPYIYSDVGNVAWDSSDTDGRPFVFAYWSSTPVPNVTGQYYAVSFSNKLTNGQKKEHGVTGTNVPDHLRLIAD